MPQVKWRVEFTDKSTGNIVLLLLMPGDLDKAAAIEKARALLHTVNANAECYERCFKVLTQ